MAGGATARARYAPSDARPSNPGGAPLRRSRVRRPCLYLSGHHPTVDAIQRDVKNNFMDNPYHN